MAARKGSTTSAPVRWRRAEWLRTLAAGGMGRDDRDRCRHRVRGLFDRHPDVGPAGTNYFLKNHIFQPDNNGGDAKSASAGGDFYAYETTQCSREGCSGAICPRKGD